MWRRFIAWLDADLAAQHLSDLDDRMLADIGVQRDGLRAQVMGVAKAEQTHDRDDVEPELCLAIAARN